MLIPLILTATLEVVLLLNPFYRWWNGRLREVWGFPQGDAASYAVVE